MVAKADKIRKCSYGDTETASDLLSHIARDVIIDHLSREVLKTSA